VIFGESKPKILDAVAAAERVAGKSHKNRLEREVESPARSGILILSPLLHAHCSQSLFTTSFCTKICSENGYSVCPSSLRSEFLRGYMRFRMASGKMARIYSPMSRKINRRVLIFYGLAVFPHPRGISIFKIQHAMMS
jgi:hypothetical protein